MPRKSICPTCEFGGKPGKIWKEKQLIDCWECEGTGWVTYPRIHVGAPRKDSPEGTAAVVYVERAKDAYFIVELDSLRAQQIGLDLLSKVRIRPTK